MFFLVINTVFIIMVFLFLLLSKLSLELSGFQPGEERWISLPLKDSCEYKVLQGKGALSISEYRQVFQEKGFFIEHMEINHKILDFKNETALKSWILTEMAPQVGREGDTSFVEEYFLQMQSLGWISSKDPHIRLPCKHLCVLLSKKT
ncbi:MAG: hypothetical protein C5B45_05720 [Chlamydiae bacterium]|nr:MAG: hypothetical protein C5B45_05720 [Chlamydiota bacterium]